MSLPPGHTCFTRPFRSKPRVFTLQDVARISKYAQKGGASPIAIIGTVAGVLGFGWILCFAAKSVDNAFTLTKFLAKIGGLLAFSKFMDFILTVVTSGAFARLARVAKLTAVVALFAAVASGIIKAVNSIVSDAAIIEEASDILHGACTAAKEAASKAGEAIGDKYDDLADWVDDF